MKKIYRTIALMLSLMMATLILSTCAGGAEGDASDGTDQEQVTTIRLAYSDNGHVFNMIAEQQGYLEEEGLTVEYVKVDNDNEVFKAMENGTIDIASNSGTNLPLQRIAEGQDLTIFGGYMLTGCMPIFAKVDTKWESIDDLIGKTFACEPNLFAISGPLLDKGYTPLKQITWLQPENQEDRIKAVLDGEADFGLVGTSLNYEINTNPDLKVCTYASDVLPNYSCCRVEAPTEWVNNNPDTVRKLLKAWIRAMEYYSAHHEEAVALVAEKNDKDEAYVRAYLDNPHCDLNVDPMKSAVVRAWEYIKRLGIVDPDAKQININDHINTELYKSALDECQAEYGKDDPKFYEMMQGQFARYNSMD